MLFEPVLRGRVVWVVVLYELPELRAVVGVGQVGDFVQADIILHGFGRADKPPVQPNAGTLAANAPKGFGARQGNVCRLLLPCLGVCGEFGQ